MPPRLNVLHAIHDFLPRHQAGSEIYASGLCHELLARHHVTVMCAEYDPARAHGDVTWRAHEGLPVVEIVNNWVCDGFEETYRPPLIGQRIAEVLDIVQPDVLHVHNLLNLSFDLPVLARARGIPVVATLHDYTLVCPSGGQRVHRAEQHVCESIEPDRCARCFADSSEATLMTMGRLPGLGRRPGLLRRAAAVARRVVPAAATTGAAALRRAAGPTVTTAEIGRRLDAARDVFRLIDVAVAPVAATARQYERLGMPADVLRVSDYGSAPLDAVGRVPPGSGGPIRIGFVGTMAWHKGVHVLLDAARLLPPDGWQIRIHADPEVFPEYAADIRKRARGLPVVLEGRFSRRETGQIFSGMDVLVVPSLWLENSPLVIHEAFMSGVPVVGARMGGIPDLVRDGESGLIYDACSPVELAAVLRDLIEDPGRLGEMGRATPRVKSMEEDAREWEGIYSGLATKSLG